MATNECPICCEPMIEQESETTECNHKFHSTCLRIWKERKNTCPMCRTQIGPDILPVDNQTILQNNTGSLYHLFINAVDNNVIQFQGGPDGIPAINQAVVDYLDAVNINNPEQQ